MPVRRQSSMHGRKFNCFCGICNVVTGTRVCLAWYILCSSVSMLFGTTSNLIWLIVPICVVSLSIYAFCTNHHKYLYPFLIITVVQLFVCILMAMIIIAFTVTSFETMRQIIGHSLQLAEPPSHQLTAIIVCGTASACILLSFLNLWQATIIYRCLEYYEEECRRIEEGVTREQLQYESRLEPTVDDVNGNQTLSRVFGF